VAFNTTNPYGITQAPNTYEQKAGVTPPQYQSYLDSNGNLKSPYQVDPSQSSAFAQEKAIAQSGDLSPWAQLQMQQNTLSGQQQRDQANAGAQGQTSQAMAQLQATGGGVQGGQSTYLAAQGARNATMANQNIGAQQQQNALGIQQTDAQNKQNLLGQVANTETGAQAANAQSAMTDTNAANLFNSNRYQQQMAAWGASQTANGQQQAANSSSKK
jgi:hypothetical protein